MLNRQRGFSLIELIVVVVMLSIIASVATPSFQSMIRKVKLEGGQGDVVKMLKEAKRIARSESTTVSVTLDNQASAPSRVILASNSGVGKTEDISAGVTFESEQTVVFTAMGAVTPPPGQPLFRLVLEDAVTSQKRYVDVTATGQVISHSPNFSP